LIELFATGVLRGEIAVFGRTETILHNRAEEAVKRVGASFRSLKDDEAVPADAIALGTMHRAKGLEFRAVVVIGCDASVLPLDLVLAGFVDDADRAEFIEQDRQLLYVACTRARERLLVTAVGELTRFLK
jgi:superfamily I DNA/RNA helicase